MATIAIVVLTAAILVFVQRAVVEMRKVGKSADELSRFLLSTGEDIANTTEEARNVLDGSARLVASATETVEHVKCVAKRLERAADLVHVASTATKAVCSSTTSLGAICEGIKQAVKVLVSHEQTKGGKPNEQ